MNAPLTMVYCMPMLDSDEQQISTSSDTVDVTSPEVSMLLASVHASLSAYRVTVSVRHVVLVIPAVHMHGHYTWSQEHSSSTSWHYYY